MPALPEPRFRIDAELVLENLRNTLSSKRNATFLKLHFFWRRVYTSESRKLICRFLMTPGYMTLTLGPRKNPWRKVAFLLEKSVGKLVLPLATRL